MDLVRTSIPYSFLKPRARLNWREVLFGLDQQLLDPGAPVDIGVDRVMEEDEPSPELVDLASMNRGEEARPLVAALSDREADQTVETIRSKWLYLVLAWIFEQREQLRDALQTVEEVYADFGYPEEVAGFVRYMPSADQELGRQQSEARLLQRWQTYLESESKKYRP